MAEQTSIEWCHHTLNIFRGCAKVHVGCTNCYAEKNVGVKMNGITWGEVWQGGQRVVMADSGWEAPFKWARAAGRDGMRRRVFCSSLADVLEVPEMPPFQCLTTERRERVNAVRKDLDGARARLWDTIRKTAAMDLDYPGPTATPRWERHLDPYAGIREDAPGLDWMLLTKRPENWHLVPEDVRPLVWLGTSISDQKTADEWVPRLLEAQGFRYRFLSMEPLVGPVDLSGYFGGSYVGLPGDVVHGGYNHGISWCIVGGESGSKARPCHVEWVRSIVEQCRTAGVACFVKQIGSAPVETRNLRGVTMAPRTSDVPMHLNSKKGGDMAEWPEDLRVREFPTRATP